jgi:hypothetical protein
MTALQKTIITATIAGLAGAGIYEARQASKLHNQVLALQQQQVPQVEQVALIQALTDATNQVAGLRNENEQLNRNSAELLKLRGEVGLLRSQAAEFARLKQELHQPEKTEQRQPPDQKPDAVAVNDFPKESWGFAGYATPDATLQTWAWAMSRGDERTMLNCLTTDGTEAMAGFLTGQKTDQPIVAGIINSMGNIPGYKITDNRVVSASEILVAMLITPSNPSDANKGMTMRLRKVGNEWKIAGPVKEE